MRKLRQIQSILCHIEDVRVDVDVIYPEGIYSQDLLELDLSTSEI